MNVYSAIMKAADHIEQNPGEFNFRSVRVPEAPGCGTPGCALGWIGTFAEVKDETYESISLVVGNDTDRELWAVKNPLLNLDAVTFYERMEALGGGNSWRRSNTECARVLRVYAERYHTREKSRQRPTSAMVADLMALVTADRIPEGMLESPEYGQ